MLKEAVSLITAVLGLVKLCWPYAREWQKNRQSPATPPKPSPKPRPRQRIVVYRHSDWVNRWR